MLFTIQARGDRSGVSSSWREGKTRSGFGGRLVGSENESGLGRPEVYRELSEKVKREKQGLLDLVRSLRGKENGSLVTVLQLVLPRSSISLRSAT
jgi:hypothetical protein